MKLNKIIFRLMAIVAIVALCASCDIHQWPELEYTENKPGGTPNVPNNPGGGGDPNDPNNPGGGGGGADDPNEPDEPDEPDDDEKSSLILHLTFAPDFYVWEHSYDPSTGNVTQLYPNAAVDADHPGTTDIYNNMMSSGQMSIHVQVYNTTSTNSNVAELSFTRDVTKGYDCDVELELLPGSYRVAVWSHLLKHSMFAPYYEPGNFRNVYIVTENYEGNTDYRDGFRGHETISLGKNENGQPWEYEIAMKRPMGKFEFVTTDLSEFLNRENAKQSRASRAGAGDYRVIISYPAYYPTAYSVMEDRLVNSSGGYSFETRMSVTGDGEASLGFDYVLINDIQDGGVQAQISVYDMSGNRVASSSMITVPVRRDHHTILRGQFLGGDSNGGVGIDPDYDGDHNMTIK